MGLSIDRVGKYRLSAAKPVFSLSSVVPVLLSKCPTLFSIISITLHRVPMFILPSPILESSNFCHFFPLPFKLLSPSYYSLVVFSSSLTSLSPLPPHLSVTFIDRPIYSCSSVFFSNSSLPSSLSTVSLSPLTQYLLFLRILSIY